MLKYIGIGGVILKKRNQRLSKREKISSAPQTQVRSEETEHKKERNTTPKGERSIDRAMPVILFGASVFLALCFILGGTGTGLLGSFIAEALKGLFSVGAYFIPALLLIQALFYTSDLKSGRRFSRFVFTVLFLLAVSCFRHLGSGFENLPAEDLYQNGKELIGGGLVGSGLGIGIIKILGKIGLVLFGILAILLYTSFFFPKDRFSLSIFGLKILTGIASAFSGVEKRAKSRKKKKQLELQEKEAKRLTKEHEKEKKAKEKREKQPAVDKSTKEKHEELFHDEFTQVDNGLSTLEIKGLGIKEIKEPESFERNPHLLNSVHRDRVIESQHETEEFDEPIQRKSTASESDAFGRRYSEFADSVPTEDTAKEEPFANDVFYDTDSVVSNVLSENADDVFTKEFNPYNIELNEKLANKPSSRASSLHRDEEVTENIADSFAEYQKQKRIDEFEKKKKDLLHNYGSENEGKRTVAFTEVEPEHHEEHVREFTMKSVSQKPDSAPSATYTAEQYKSETPLYSEPVYAAEKTYVAEEPPRYSAPQYTTEKTYVAEEAPRYAETHYTAETIPATEEDSHYSATEKIRYAAQAELPNQTVTYVTFPDTAKAKPAEPKEELTVKRSMLDTFVREEEPMAEEPTAEVAEIEDAPVQETTTPDLSDIAAKFTAPISEIPEDEEEEEDEDESDVLPEPEEETEKEEIPPEEQNPAVAAQRNYFSFLKDEDAKREEEETEATAEEPVSENEIDDEPPFDEDEEEDDEAEEEQEAEDDEEEPPFDDFKDTSEKFRKYSDSFAKPAPKPEKKEAESTFVPPDYSNYQFPPLDLFLRGDTELDPDIEAEIQDNADKLLDTLASFNVAATIRGWDRGPRITRYEVVPARGVKVSSVTKLEADITLNLAAEGIRMEAPIPGKSAIGFEIPNKHPQKVCLRDLMECEEFQNAKSKTFACIGKDVTGMPIFGDIGKMPHLLVAGATGMGKSVCINAMLLSILFRARPDEVKFIMVDPKKVEFKGYNGIPHLLVPVVTEAKQAAGALMWACDEMEKRFDLIESLSVKKIDDYNAKVRANPELGQPMSKIIIVIDELNDLMLQVRDPVENLIMRISQKARAAGIHLIIGTQRPSVDVITGVIKSNIPSRMSCKVSSAVNSRTVLEAAGAEKLLNNGDMLYWPVGNPAPIRVQGAFVSDDEIERMMEFLRSQATGHDINEDILDEINRAASKCSKSRDDEGEEDDGDDENMGGFLNDQKFLDAVNISLNAGKVSTSLLQRKCGLGYGRAAKYIDTMEDLGIVSEKNGQKPRDVLITKQDWQEMLSRRELD